MTKAASSVRRGRVTVLVLRVVSAAFALSSASCRDEERACELNAFVHCVRPDQCDSGYWCGPLHAFTDAGCPRKPCDDDADCDGELEVCYVSRDPVVEGCNEDNERQQCECRTAATGCHGRCVDARDVPEEPNECS